MWGGWSGVGVGRDVGVVEWDRGWGGGGGLMTFSASETSTTSK